MQLFSSIITTLWLLAMSIQPTFATVVVRVVFNNGVLPTKQVCTSADNTTINNAINSVNIRRYLKTTHGNATISTMGYDITTDSRDLATYPASCKSACMGIKCCHAVRCAGYDGTIHGRKASEFCSDIWNTLNNKLNNLAVTSTCKTYIQSSTRNIACYDDIQLGEVTGAKIFEITSSGQTSKALTTTGSSTVVSVCKNKMINVQALVNECVDVVGFDIKGPNGYALLWVYEKNPPYNVFGGDDLSKMIGQYLPHTGSYTVTIKPDNFGTKQKYYTFNVNNCS